MLRDDFDDDDVGESTCPMGVQTPPDLEAIAAHPLLPRGIPPALCGQLLALVGLNSAGYVAQMDDPFFTLDHEDHAMTILPSIRACRERIITDLQEIGIERPDITDEVISELSSRVRNIHSDLEAITEFRTGAKPSLSYSRAYELPLDPEMQRQSVILLEEMLIFRRRHLWCADLTEMAENPRGPVTEKHREFLSGKFGSAQWRPILAIQTRTERMEEILINELRISHFDARLTVQDLLQEAYPERFPLDQPSPIRKRQLWEALLKEQKELRRQEKYRDTLMN